MKAFVQESEGTAVDVWEVQVVAAATGFIELRQAKSATLICIEDRPDSPSCSTPSCPAFTQTLGFQQAEERKESGPRLVEAVRKELGLPEFPIVVRWMRFSVFVTEFGGDPGGKSGSLLDAAEKPDNLLKPAKRQAGARVRSHSRGSGPQNQSSGPSGSSTGAALGRGLSRPILSTGSPRSWENSGIPQSTMPGAEAEFASVSAAPAVIATDSAKASHNPTTVFCKKDVRRPSGALLSPVVALQVSQSAQTHPIQASTSTMGSGGAPSSLNHLKTEEWPDLVLAARTPTSGTSRLRKQSAAGRSRSSGHTQQRSRSSGTVRSMQPRRDPLAIVWKCQECQKTFVSHDLLLDHQQSEGHWSATLEPTGRTFVRKYDAKAHHAESGSTSMEDDSFLNPPTGCECFSLSSPRQ